MPGQLAKSLVLPATRLFQALDLLALRTACSFLESPINCNCVSSLNFSQSCLSGVLHSSAHKELEEVVKMPPYAGASVRDRTSELTGIADRLQRQQVFLHASSPGGQIFLQNLSALLVADGCIDVQHCSAAR